MISFKFNEKKATQVASLFIEKEGKKINYMKLIKLLYFTDRQALLNWERPLTGDRYVSMPKGPVLSNILDIINYGEDPNDDSYWCKFIDKYSKYEVQLVNTPEQDELSRREIKLIDEIYKEFGEFNEWDLVRMSHDILPEWDEEAEKNNTSIPISINNILHVEGKTEEEIKEIEDEVETLNYVDKLLQLDS